MEFPWGNELLSGEFPMKNVNPWGISGGIKNRDFKCISYQIFSMGKIHREMNFPWGISNEKC